MATKTKSRPAVAAANLFPISNSWSMSMIPLTTEDRLTRIQALGKRIDGYIAFMCSVNQMNGSSAEAKHKAVQVFYERLRTVEQELGQIQEELRLG